MSTMSQQLISYISSLPVGTPPKELLETKELVEAVNIDDLPNGLVTGSNLIQFPEEASPELKSSVTLSLLAAQRVASNDPYIQTPEGWLQSHNKVLEKLNWINEGGGTVKYHFDNIDVAVHQAIIPFLTSAFGGGVGTGALIMTVLNQLQEMDKDSPWITFYDYESRRFNVTEYQFSIVEVKGDTVHLRMVSARLDASFGKTQVLFFKIKKQNAAFEQTNQSYATEASLLEDMNEALKDRLKELTRAYIRSIPEELLHGAPPA